MKQIYSSMTKVYGPLSRLRIRLGTDSVISIAFLRDLAQHSNNQVSEPLHLCINLINQNGISTMTDLQALHYEHANNMLGGLKEGEVSTGTTILSIPFDGGVVVCADSRTSTGSYVANRVSDKLVQLSEYIYCCRSGSAADTQTLTDYVHYFLNQWR
jgi:Proteasome subunit